MENENQVMEPEENEEHPAMGEEPADTGADPSDGGSFEDGDEGKLPSPDKKPPQTAAENARQAEKRRTREAVSASERNAIIIDALGGKNPFTGGEMKDAEDVEEYLLQKEIEAAGGDPVSDLSAFRKQRAREAREAAEREVKGQERVAREIKEFHTSHPDVDPEALFRDKDFLEYADGKLGKKSLSEVYASFTGLKKRLAGESDTKDEEAKQAQAAANAKAGVGSLSSSHKESQDFYTPEQVRAMSREEVRANFEKIKKSMQKWK